MPYFPEVKLSKNKVPIVRQGKARQLRSIRKALSKLRESQQAKMDEDSKLRTATFLFFFVPHLKLKEISRATGLTQYKIKQHLEKEYNIKSFKTYTPSKSLKSRKIDYAKMAQEARKGIREIYQPFFLGKNNYFRKTLLGDDLLTYVQTEEIPLTRRGDFTTSAKKILLRNTRERIIRLMKRAHKKSSLNKQEMAEVDRRMKQIEKRLDEIGFDFQLCPAYANKDKETRGETRMLTDPKSGRPFSRPVLNIPYYNYNPPKRIQEAAHNIAKKPDFKLLHAEKPLISAGTANGLFKKTGDTYDDIEGVNLKVRLPRTWEEFLKTYESGVIITKNAAEKLRYKKISPPMKVRVVNPNDLLPEGSYVKRGDLVIKKNALARNSKFISLLTSKYEGRIKYLDELVEQSRVPFKPFYATYIVIERETTPQPGDKLTSRTGLKGVISDIIDKDPHGADLIINPLDIWQWDKKTKTGEIKDNEKKRRGAMVKEILDSNGYMFTTFEPGEFAIDNTSMRLKVSPTFIGGFAEYGKWDALKNYVPPERLRSLFEFLHLKVVKTPEGEYVIALDKRPPEIVKDTKKIEFKHNWYGVQDYDYLAYPDLLIKFDTSKKGYPYPTFPVKGMSEKEQWIAFTKAMNAAVSIIYSNAFRPTYTHARLARLVERPVKLDEIILPKRIADALHVKVGDWVTISKEPVTSIGSIRTLKVKEITDKMDAAVGIHPLLASEYMNADFDGDQVAVFTPPVKHDIFIPKEKDIQEKLNELKDVHKEIKTKKENWLRELEKHLKFVPDDVLAKKVAQYNRETYEHDNAMIKGRGGPRRTYFAFFPLIQKFTGLTPELVNTALNIEKAMKKKTLPADRYRELVALFGKDEVKKSLKLIRAAEKEDADREKKVIAIIRKFMADHPEYVNPRSWIIKLYREDKDFKRQKTISNLVGNKLYPDLFWLDRMLVRQVGVQPITNKDKDSFVLTPLKKRKKKFKESKQIQSLRNYLAKLRTQLKEMEKARISLDTREKLMAKIIDTQVKIAKLEAKYKAGYLAEEEKEAFESHTEEPKNEEELEV